jgi:NAD(P)-dependent dehydrogenase (short-subunit alcohol dehydrogenase family)
MKVAIITGGQRGIGLGIAQQLARNGFRVVIADLIDAENEAHAIQSQGSAAVSIVTDVSRDSCVNNLFDQVVERFGRVDVLVNNAVNLQKGTVVDHSSEVWDQIVGVNLKGPFLCSRRAIKQMRQNNGGTILNVGSEYGIRGASALAIYATSKAGLHHLTKMMAIDHARDGIRVNCLVPGPVLTPLMHQNITGSPDPATAHKRETDSTILKRFGTVEEIAKVAAFLVSDEASFITGSVVAADGGVTSL